VFKKIGFGFLYGVGLILGASAIGVILLFGAGVIQLVKTGGPVLVSPGGGRTGSAFIELSLERRINSASLIALARFDTRGDNARCRISEILKVSPDTQFGFKVGDVYPYCHQYKKDGNQYHEGLVLFFFGNPPDLQGVTFFEGDKVSQLGGMSLSELRQEIKK
jgi:hypothetical protein